MIKNITKTSVSILIFLYFSIFTLLLLTGVFHMEFTKENIGNLVILDFVNSFVLTLVMLFLYRKVLAKDKEKLKENKIGTFLSSAVVAFIVMNIYKIAGSYLSQMISAFIGISEVTTDNQEIIEKLLGSAPAMMIISACIFAPITEEIVFRGAIGQAIKNKKFFIAVSGLIFGLMHVTDSVFLLFEILLIGCVLDFIFNKYHDKQQKIRLSVLAVLSILILFCIPYYLEYGNLFIKIINLDAIEVVGSLVYILMGFYLAVLYVEQENLYLNIVVHSLNNIMSMIAILFLL